MLIANTTAGLSSTAIRGLVGFCPSCHQELIPKCGIIKIHHWAHKIKADCVYKPETMWHLEWKQIAMKFHHEVEVNFKMHIADILTQSGRIIELQNSTITAEDIVSRSEFYRILGYNIDWIFNFKEKYDKDQLIIHKNYDDNGNIYHTFKQKWQKHSLQTLFNLKGYQKYGAIYIDIGEEIQLLRIKKLYDRGSGWGKYVHRTSVFNKEI